MTPQRSMMEDSQMDGLNRLRKMFEGTCVFASVSYLHILRNVFWLTSSKAYGMKKIDKQIRYCVSEM